MSTGSHRAWVEIDLSALERNLQRIRAALPPWIRYVAVVKADAYGHGMVATVSRLMLAGADAFAVANLREAAEIQEIGGGWPILILSALLPEEVDRAVAQGVIPAISSSGECDRLAEAARRAGRSLTVHLKIDTGMGRLGVWHEEAIPLCQHLLACDSLHLGGVFTHFSSADGDPEYTHRQRELFLQVWQSLPLPDPAGLLVHADNSAGLETLGQEGPFNAVRIGLLQFGVRPYPGSFLESVEVAPVLSFHSRVGLVKQLPAGTAISYGRTHVLARPTRVAILTAGYADGLPTSLSNQAQVLIAGRRCSVLGRVTMDQTIVDVTDVPGVEPGDRATWIGRQGEARITVQEFSCWAGDIPWEVFVSISKRVQRLYLRDSAV